MAIIKKFSFLDAEPMMALDLTIKAIPGRVKHLNLCCPSKERVERFLKTDAALLDELTSETESKDTDELTRKLYGAAAELMSINATNERITGDDLREKYAVSEEKLILFFYAYADFITEIANLKN